MVQLAMPRAKRVFEEVRGHVITAALMLFAGTAIGQPFIVPSGSMEPTLMVGDEIAAAKYAYGYSRYSSPIGVIPSLKGRILDRAPERGDIVVFALPRDTAQTYVKRLIGLPGDRVQMRGGELYINDELVQRRAVGPVMLERGTSRGAGDLKYVETLPNGRALDIIKVADGMLDETSEYSVAVGLYFMMGDNRDNSLDSRVSPDEGGVGFVPAENLIGRVDRVLFSIAPFGNWLQAISDPIDLRMSRWLHRVN